VRRQRVTVTLLAAFGVGGCLVSFDGYHSADASGGALGQGGETTGGSGGNGISGSGGNRAATGGSRFSTGGVSEGGRGGTADPGEAGAGNESGRSSGGTLGSGGDASAGDNGTATGGSGARSGSGGAAPNGGSTTGGATTGGKGTGGKAGGGTNNGGAGGKATGGAASGGTATGGVSTGGAVTGGSGTGGAASPSCPVLAHGPILVEVPTGSGGIFCIDRTEVTNADYGAFLASNPSTSAQSSACAWNANFAPEAGADCATTNYDPTNRAKTPVDCIDWCDAATYCAWAGKHLCGRVGGGPNAPASFADATKSEWYAACSHAGELEFPYGNSYQADACVSLDSPLTRAGPVPNAACQGGYEGIYDMSGNLAEWEDSCSASAGAGDNCLNRGGSYLSSDTAFPSLRCNSNLSGNPKAKSSRRDARSQDLGFRCCYDP
jgi:sulfatase modifying factor 1